MGSMASLPRPTGAHFHGDFAEGPAVDAGDIAAVGTDRRKDLFGFGQGTLMIHDVLPPWGLMHSLNLARPLPEAIKSRIMALPCASSAAFWPTMSIWPPGLRRLPSVPVAALPRQSFDGFVDFEGIADGRSQGRRHGRNDGPRRTTGEAADAEP